MYAVYKFRKIFPARFLYVGNGTTFTKKLGHSTIMYRVLRANVQGHSAKKQTNTNEKT